MGQDGLSTLKMHLLGVSRIMSLMERAWQRTTALLPSLGRTSLQRETGLTRPRANYTDGPGHGQNELQPMNGPTRHRCPGGRNCFPGLSPSPAPNEVEKPHTRKLPKFGGCFCQNTMGTQGLSQWSVIHTVTFTDQSPHQVWESK